MIKNIRDLTREGYESIVKEAVLRIIEEKGEYKPVTPCLSSKTIIDVVKGRFPESRRESMLKHLEQCRKCCDDVRLCFDLYEYHRVGGYKHKK